MLSFLASLVEFLGAIIRVVASFFRPKSDVEKANAEENKVVSMSDQSVHDELYKSWKRKD